MSLGKLQMLKQSNKNNSAVVIFLHGSLDTGTGLLKWIKHLLGDNFALPHIKFLFPTSPVRPYTPLGGKPTNVWFDRLEVRPDVPDLNETMFSIKEELIKLIQSVSEYQRIPLNRIVIGGFSMGGALAFHMAYRFYPGLKGCFTMSSFINNNSELYKEIVSEDTALYMCHGENDNFVPIEWGKKTYEDLKKFGVKGEFVPIKHCGHEIKKEELEEIMEWLQKVLPPLPSDK